VVGERHVVDVFLRNLQGPGRPHLVEADRFKAAVRELELGRGFAQDEVAGRWHGLLDAVVLVQAP